MVVAEARSRGVKVLTSSEVGSVDLGFNDLIAIKPNAPLHYWVEALEELISKVTIERLSVCGHGQTWRVFIGTRFTQSTQGFNK